MTNTTSDPRQPPRGQPAMASLHLSLDVHVLSRGTTGVTAGARPPQIHRQEPGRCHRGAHYCHHLCYHPPTPSPRCWTGRHHANPSARRWAGRHCRSRRASPATWPMRHSYCSRRWTSHPRGGRRLGGFSATLPSPYRLNSPRPGAAAPREGSCSGGSSNAAPCGSSTPSLVHNLPQGTSTRRFEHRCSTSRQGKRDGSGDVNGGGGMRWDRGRGAHLINWLVGPVGRRCVGRSARVHFVLIMHPGV
jgi:hypothetical protein